MKQCIRTFLFLMLFSQLSLYAQPNSNELKVLAEKLVTNCAGINEGEKVLITGGVRDLELLENLAVEVRKTGAFPMISIGSDRLTRLMFTDVPAKFDSQKLELDLKLADIFTSIISVDYGETEGLLKDIPADRLLTNYKQTEEVTILFRNRKAKNISLGNGLYPTDALAGRYKISKQTITDIFWKGVNVDFNMLRNTGETLINLLSAGKNIHITTNAGTDLNMNIADRKVHLSDGILSDDDLRSGLLNVWLPAGEVYLVPNINSVNGTVVIKKHFYDGVEIEDFKVVFKDGKVITLSAKSGLERFKKMYDAAGSGIDEFAFLDFGINPNVKIPENSDMVTWMSAGMVTIGIGSNIWAGGENTIPLSHNIFLKDATVSMDGKIIVENGVLKY